jgi:hypothetical protein
MQGLNLLLYHVVKKYQNLVTLSLDVLHAYIPYKARLKACVHLSIT